MGQVLEETTTGGGRGQRGLQEQGCATVLFVDDEPAVLSGLGRILHLARPGWRAVFAGNGEQALQLLAGQQVDVVVADMMMPGMNGAQLLAAVQDNYPGAARLLLSGCVDRDKAIASVGPAQQFLSKPVNADALMAAVDRVLGLNCLIGDPRIREALGGVARLPKPPQIYQRMIEVTADPEYDLDDVVEVICDDLMTSAEVLRLISSSFFGFTTRVDSIARAVTLLGLPTVQALAVAGGVFRSGPILPAGLDAETLSRDGLAVASIARRIAQAEGWPSEAVADMFTAGLLHQVGLPVLASAQPQQWATIRQISTSGARAEDEVFAQQFGCSPCQASAYLLGLWGFPEPVVHTVADQPADPNASPAAHLLSYARHVTQGPGTPPPPSATGGYLDTARLTHWQDLLTDHASD
jgi:HD-like signal output (HDOD) protein/CheY-like chemotaxis protein